MMKFFSIRLWLLWLLLLVLAAAAGRLWHLATTTRQEIAATGASLNAGPQTAARSASLQVELNRRQKDVERLQRYLLSQEELGQFVSALEQEATQAKIEVTIPAVQEKPVFDEQGRPVPATGATRQVNFDITATGAPENLLEFLHRVESLPYLLYLQSWSVTTDTLSVRRRIISNVPLPSDAVTPSPTPLPGRLQAQFVLAITNSPP